jgi:hypothetical protein
MEDDKWVHGICRPEDAGGQARLGRDFFFALLRWANERTKTEEIQGDRLESNIGQTLFGKDESRGSVRASLQSTFLSLFPFRGLWSSVLL